MERLTYTSYVSSDSLEHPGAYVKWLAVRDGVIELTFRNVA